MDPMHFSIKRVYWSGHARIRELVVPLGITPARADLLRVVAMHEQGMPQATLMQHLGVSPPTISKMLSAMVEKGWVERFASKNGNIIHATRAGLVLIAQVIERFILSGALPLRMAMAWGHGIGVNRESLYRLLNRARRALLDRAPFLHPWRKEATYVRRHYTFWEARLRADDLDDTVAEDLEKIRARAKAPIAREPPPRTARELENIEAHRRDRDGDADGPLRWTDPPAQAASWTDPPAQAASAAQHTAVETRPEASRRPATPGDEDGVVTKSVVDGRPVESSLDGGSVVPTSVVDGRETSAVADVPSEVLQLWKNLMDLGNVRGLGLEDMPKWGEPGS